MKYDMMEFAYVFSLAIIGLFMVISTIVMFDTIWSTFTYLTESFKSLDNNTLDTHNISQTKYTSYSDMVLQETIANREKYLNEIKSRDVAESYPWISIDGVWEQGSLFPTNAMNSREDNGMWKKRRKWVPYQRQYKDFGEVLYIGNPLPQ